MSRINTTLSTIITQIKTALQTNWASTSVYVTDKPDLATHTQDDVFISLRAGAFDQFNAECLLMQGTIDVTVWVRVTLDDTNRADSLLLDSSLGLLQFCDDVTSLLNLRDLTDTNGDFILAQPMRLKSQATPERQANEIGWSSCVLTFEVLFGYGFGGGTANPNLGAFTIGFSGAFD